MISYGIWGWYVPRQSQVNTRKSSAKYVFNILDPPFCDAHIANSRGSISDNHGLPMDPPGGPQKPPRPCQGPRSLKSSLAMPMSSEWSVQPEMPSVPAESNLTGKICRGFFATSSFWSKNHMFLFFSPFEVFLVFFGNQSIDINWHCWASEKDLDLLREPWKIHTKKKNTRVHNCGINQWGNAKECPTGPLLNRTHKKNP